MTINFEHVVCHEMSQVVGDMETENRDALGNSSWSAAASGSCLFESV